jgi:hypothetical protein
MSRDLNHRPPRCPAKNAGERPARLPPDSRRRFGPRNAVGRRHSRGGFGRTFAVPSRCQKSGVLPNPAFEAVPSRQLDHAVLGSRVACRETLGWCTLPQSHHRNRQRREKRDTILVRLGQLASSTNGDRLPTTPCVAALHRDLSSRRFQRAPGLSSLAKT